MNKEQAIEELTALRVYLLDILECSTDEKDNDPKNIQQIKESFDAIASYIFHEDEMERSCLN